MAKFILRIDDVCPTMSWSNFDRMEAFCDARGIAPLIGVVPDNRDPDLRADPARSDFWGRLRSLRDKGWAIAQHGYQHRAHTADRGLLRIGSASEFAGLPADEQARMLKEGRAILRREGIETDIFMAPRHSFDQKTLRALRSLGFRYVTDGYGLYPYREEGLVFVPQLFSSPVNFRFGIYTMCLHLNYFDESRWAEFESFAARRREDIVPFQWALGKAKDGPLYAVQRGALKLALTGARALRGLMTER